MALKFKQYYISALVCAVLSLGAVSSPALAEEVSAVPGAELHMQTPKRGWFWYKNPAEDIKEEEVKEVIRVPAQETAPEPEEPVVVVPNSISTPEPVEEVEACSTMETWSADCGFVDPGADFDFQAKQRDELLKMMSLTPDNPDAVEAAQRYMKWVVGKASMAANMWYFNMTQNPDLDPTVQNPISEVGLALASRVENASSLEYYKVIREEGGILFYITRDDCIYCHDQMGSTKRVARTMGLPLINVPIDKVCLEGFEGETCGDNVPEEQIAALNVQTVPALYLYVPEATWIRIGTGVVSDATIMANTVNFFSAYRAALLSGLDNSKGSRPSVSFDPDIRPTASGTANADGSYSEALPSKDNMLDLLGFSESN